MSSASLTLWRNDRTPRLNAIDTQYAQSLAMAPPDPLLVDENLRGYIVLLSAHFQGFCRDLYSECAQIIASKVRPILQVLILDQFIAHRALDRGNPNHDNLRRDFQRFGFTLDLAAADPANRGRLQILARLNEWRNIAAHQGPVPAGGLPGLADLRACRNACDGLAGSLDGIMYNHLKRILRREPWVP